MKKLLGWTLLAAGALVSLLALAAAYVALAPIPSYPVAPVRFEVDVTPARAVSPVPGPNAARSRLC